MGVQIALARHNYAPGGYVRYKSAPLILAKATFVVFWQQFSGSGCDSARHFGFDSNALPSPSWQHCYT